MITTTTYHRTELKRGKCKSCGEISNEILKSDGRCLDCIEEENFISAVEKQFDEKDCFRED